MARGYMGKILNVDLPSGTLAEESLNEMLCRQYIGGYGVGARLLYDRIPARVDPLEPDNILGFMTGRFTGGRLNCITLNHQKMRREFLQFVGWDVHTTIPREESLRRLGMEFLLEDIEDFQVPAA